VVLTRSGYCSLLCTTVADIEKFQFLDFLKVFEPETWVMYVSTAADLVSMVSTWSGYCSWLCTSVADIEKFQFFDFLKYLGAETWLVYVIGHGGPRQSGFDTIGLL